MMLHVPGVLTAEQVTYMRQQLEAADWVDGRETVGPQGAQVKRNRQLPEVSPVRATWRAWCQSSAQAAGAAIYEVPPEIADDCAAPVEDEIMPSFCSLSTQAIHWSIFDCRSSGDASCLMPP